jgi:TRAP-type C4-dicarboxylate transport system permease small subunit
VKKVNILLYIIAGIALTFMIIFTLCNVILRNIGYPITGSYEITKYTGSIVFGFAIPYGTWLGAQVIVDIVTDKLNPKNKKIIDIITRCAGIILFVFIAYNFYLYGFDVLESGQLTDYFRISYAPFVFCLSFSFLFQGLTVVCDLIKTVTGGKDE